MKRFQFLASMLGLVGIVKAQNCTTGIPPVCEPKTVTSSITSHYMDDCQPVTARPTDYGRKPMNGECPTCGTMASPRRKSYTMGIVGGLYGQYKEIEIEHSRVIRCKHCNAAFWQDAE